ncbi:MAG: LamG domain-containing protein [Candidatus Paceibacterota bacterium]
MLLTIPGNQIYADNTHSIEFDGSNDYLYTADSSSLSITQDLTAEMWVNFDSFNTDQGILISKYGGGTNERAYQFGYFKNTSDGKQYFESRISDDGTGINTTVVTLEYDLATSTWYHVSFIYKSASGTVDVYLATTSAESHIHAGTMSGHKNSIKDSISQFRIASSHGAGNVNYFDGKIDDVRIWNKAREVSNINTDFKSELVGTEANLKGYWRFNDTLTDQTANGNTLSDYGGTIFSESKPFPNPPSAATSPYPSHSSTTVATSTSLSWNPGSNLTQQGIFFGTSSTITINDYQGTYGTSTTNFDPGTLSASTTYYWRIDSNNLEATTTGTVWDFTTTAEPENTHSIALDGVDDYLSAPDSNSLSITGDLTIEFWVKFDSFNIDDQGILVSKWGDYGGGNNQRAYQFGYYKTSGGIGYFDTLTSADGTTVGSGTVQYDLSTEKWYHLAFVYTAASGTVDVYVATTSDSNHILAGTVSGHTTSLKDTVSDFQIGSSDGSGNIVYFDGNMDEIRVWNTAKSKEEIDSDFDTEFFESMSNLQAYWKLNNHYSDQTSNDNTLSQNNGANFSTIVPFPVSPNSHAISLNGIDQYLSAVDSHSLSITSDLTAELWVKFNSFNEDNQGVLISKYGNYGGTDNQRSYQFGYYKDTSKLDYNFFNTRTSTDGTDTSDLNRAYPMATGTWYHLAFVYDASEGCVDIYLANVNDTEHSFVGAECRHKTLLKDTVSSFEIGSSDGSGNVVYLDGVVDEVRIWSKTRSKSEMDADYTLELTGSETDLEAYWNFNNTLSDMTSNGNTLTNNNSATFITSTPF